MKKTNYFIALVVFCSVANMAQAADFNSDTWAKERFRIRARAIAVSPQDSTSLNIAGDLDVGTAYTPELDVSYFFTKNIAAELIAATSKHKIKYNGSTPVGSVWALPPTVTLQYHFTPEKDFSPYVGVGLNYSIFYGEDDAGGFNNLKVGNTFGYAIQAGYDYWLDDHWGLNFDVKKIFMDMDATTNNGAIQADINLNPWVVGAGVSYRF